MTTKPKKIEKLDLFQDKYLVKETTETDLLVLVNKINEQSDAINYLLRKMK